MSHLDIPRLNPSGLPDPTAYEALKADQRRRFGYRPVAYICSPYAGDTEANVALARRISRALIDLGRIPLAPHLLLPQFMNDDDPEQRELAMFMNRIILSKCEEVWIYAPRVSPGMRDEAYWAHAIGTPIHFLNEQLQEVTA